MIGRNDLCSCGSGKKYKKCCLNKDKATSMLERQLEVSQKQDAQVTQELFRFSRNEKFYNEYLKAKERFFILDNEEMVTKFIEFFNTYYLYDHMTDDNKTMARLFCESNRINEAQLGILKNKLSSYVSIYKVKSINGNKAVLMDLILDEETFAQDRNVVDKLKVDEILIGRLCDVAGVRRFIDNVVSISESIKDLIVNDILLTYDNTKEGYDNKRLFLVYNNAIIYKYIQQLLDPSVAAYLRQQKQDPEAISNDAKVESKSTNDDNECMVNKLIRENVDSAYLEVAIAKWEEFKQNNETKGSENGWASAIEYSVKKENGDNVTQGEIAKKYSVSPSTLGKRFKELRDNQSK